MNKTLAGQLANFKENTEGDRSQQTWKDNPETEGKTETLMRTNETPAEQDWTQVRPEHRGEGH